jgi:hypothetical protein
MQDENQTYRVGHVTFIVTPVYHPAGKGESLLSILLKLMKADIVKK